MFTRVAQGKRPRRPAYLFMVAGSVAAILVASVALALISDSGTYDVTVPDSGSSITADLGNATVEYIGSSASNQSSGTGLFDPFVRLQGSPTEAGYNTCSQSLCGGDVSEFDTKTGSWTHAIKASAIPTVDCGGDLAGTQCWELFNDINEGNSAKYISLNEVEVWLTTNANITGYSATTGFAGATQVYDFTGSILIHDVNQGSGRGDLRYLIPVQTFTSSDYFVLYSKWGTTSGTAPDGKTWGSEGGFEEWKVRKAPNVSILKTTSTPSVNAGSPISFDITISNSGAAAASNVSFSDPLPTNAGLDWSISPAVSGCSISGALGAEVLTCTFSSLAAGQSITVHVTSPTTTASCGTLPNTATITSGGTGFSSATVTVLCGALQITKTAKHADTSGNTSANLVATFTIVDAAGTSRTLTTNAAGKGCISGVAIGTTTSITETSVPTGYSAPTIANVNVASGSCSGAELGTGGTNVNVTNTPLTTIGWSVDSLRNGGTKTTVTCRDSAGNVISGYPITVSDGSGSLPNLPPTSPGVTVTCAFVVDP